MSEYLRRVEATRVEWSRQGVDCDALVFSNYNPILARAKFDSLEEKKHVETFRKYESQNIETALRERNHAGESRVQFFIDSHNKIRNEHFLGEAYEEVLQRGIAYRAAHGSREQAREQSELVGFQLLQSVLTDTETPIGTKYLVISPPGVVTNTVYPDNYVDIYELAQDSLTNERYIKCVRFASGSLYADYQRIIPTLQPDYFAHQTGSIDAWYLSHPVLVSATEQKKSVEEVFDSYFKKDPQAILEAEFQARRHVYMPFAAYYLDQLTKPDCNPIQIVKAWNTLLNSTEQRQLQHEILITPIRVQTSEMFIDHRMYQQIGRLVDQFGGMDVREVKAGCGNSGGIKFKAFDVDDLDPIKVFQKNSVAQFANKGLELEESAESEWFKCPDCGYQADGPIGNECPQCKLTKEKYAQKTGQPMCA